MNGSDDAVVQLNALSQAFELLGREARIVTGLCATVAGLALLISILSLVVFAALRRIRELEAAVFEGGGGEPAARTPHAEAPQLRLVAGGDR